MNASSRDTFSQLGKWCPWLIELVRTVLCGRVPVILLYGLPYVKMVRASKGSENFPIPAEEIQAVVLYPIRRGCSTFDDELLDRLCHLLGLVSFWGF